ncbi:MAG: TOMM precursor leader peptide-binding protein [Pseudomonadota bacterium]
MKNTDIPILHPVTSVLLVDENRLQLRNPDKINMTFDKDIDKVIEVIDKLNGTNSFESIKNASYESSINSEFVEELFRLMEMQNYVIPKEDIFPDDYLLKEIDLMSRKVKQGFQSLQITEKGKTVSKLDFNSMIIEGNGIVADAMRKMSSHVDFPLLQNEADSNARTLIVCCADNENFHYLRELNKKYVSKKIAVVFAYLNDATMHLGPLVVPGESACFECLYHRRKANMHHVDEFNAYLDNCASTSSTSKYKDSEMLKNFVSYSTGFLLAAIKNQIFNVLEPGKLYSFNMANYESRSRVVTRLPRCPVCGVSPDNQVLQAVRSVS